MANFIYNTFLKSIATNVIDLTKKNTYKVCLLKENFSEILTSEDKETNNNDNYITISLSGFECKDTGKYTGYIQGGNYVTIFKKDLYKSDNTLEFYFEDKIVWYNITLKEENRPRYVLLYREGDGQAIACFDLGNVIDFNEDDLILDWGNNPIMRIASVNPEKAIDSTYSLTSKNSLQNKKITEGFFNLGVAIGNEKSNLPETKELKVDTLNRIDDKDIELMFDED